MTITLKPRMLAWARERAGLQPDQLAKRIGIKPARVNQWENDGELKYSHLEKLARKTHTPLGFLFLQNPPEEKLPISDLRTIGDNNVEKPSPELLETVETMQKRQAWMRQFLIENGEEPLAFVGSESVASSPIEVAKKMRSVLGFKDGWAADVKSWPDVLSFVRDRIEGAGILIMLNGVVGNNTHRPLSTKEFRGFALPDSYAPLIFINNTDAKSAQMFTVAHELAHIWIGAGGVSNFSSLQPSNSRIEYFCNTVAAEFLIPSNELHACWKHAENNGSPFNYLSRQFKVSPIVAARRAQDLGLISKERFLEFYKEYRAREKYIQDSKKDGGNFWNSNGVRLGNRFGRAIVIAAKHGRLNFRDAYDLTSLKPGAFSEYASQIGFRI